MEMMGALRAEIDGSNLRGFVRSMMKYVPTTNTHTDMEIVAHLEELFSEVWRGCGVATALLRLRTFSMCWFAGLWWFALVRVVYVGNADRRGSPRGCSEASTDLPALSFQHFCFED